MNEKEEGRLEERRRIEMKRSERKVRERIERMDEWKRKDGKVGYYRVLGNN